MHTSTCHGWEIQRSPCLDDIFLWPPIPLFSCNYAALLLVIHCWSANIVLIGQPPIAIVSLDLIYSPLDFLFQLSAALWTQHCYVLLSYFCHVVWSLRRLSGKKREKNSMIPPSGFRKTVWFLCLPEISIVNEEKRSELCRRARIWVYSQ